MSGYLTTFWNSYTHQSWFTSTVPDTDQGYAETLIPATAVVAGETGGAAAWAWIAQTTLSHPAITNDPKWAIVPRTPVQPPSDTQVPSTPGNLQGTATSSSQVALSWNASTDNVGVIG